MRLIVLSPPQEYPDEAHIVNELFGSGLQTFHLRKPAFTRETLERYINLIPAEYHRRIVIHFHYSLAKHYHFQGIHLTEKARHSSSVHRIIRELKEKSLSTSFHSLEELRSHRRRYTYVFISPVFDSISKPDYKSTFNPGSLRETIAALKKRNNYVPQLIALGGIETKNIPTALSLGFAGVAVLGAVWESKEPVEAFRKIKTLTDR